MRKIIQISPVKLKNAGVDELHIYALTDDGIVWYKQPHGREWIYYMKSPDMEIDQPRDYTKIH